MKTLLFMLEEMCSITDSFSFTQSLQPSSYHQEPRRIYKPGYDGICRKTSYLSEDRLVVIYVVNSYNNLSKTAERGGPPRDVVIYGSDVQNVLRPSQAGQRASAEFNDT